MKSKWFKIDEKAKSFDSKRRARTKKEALEKTLRKWELITIGYFPYGQEATCGLCNIYRISHCNNCPINKMTGGGVCNKTPYRMWYDNQTTDNALLEYLFLLFVKEATK